MEYCKHSCISKNIVKCKINQVLKEGLKIKEVYESTFPSKHGVINGECLFDSMGSKSKCPFFLKN